MRTPTLLALALTLAAPALRAAEPCRVIHGRARAYPADGQLRIWDIGTHHTLSPDASSQAAVMKFLDWHGSKQLFADFTVCPTAPYVKGATQPVTVKSIDHPRVVAWTN